MDNDKKGSIEIVLNERDYQGNLTGRRKRSGQTNNPEEVSQYYHRNRYHKRKRNRHGQNRNNNSTNSTN